MANVDPHSLDPEQKSGGQGGRKLATVLLVAIALGTAVNLLQFSGADEAARHNYKALYAYETRNLFEIAISHDDSARERVAPFYYLGELFPGSTVITPARGVSMWFTFDESVFAFGRVVEVLRADYEPRGLVDLEAISEYRMGASSFAPYAGRTATVIDGRVGYYALSPGPTVFVVVTPYGSPGRTGFVAFVDVRLIDESLVSTLGLP